MSLKFKEGFFVCFILVFTPSCFSLVSAYNYESVNVTTRVNITHSMPEVMSVLVTPDITLNAGGFKTVYCNASIRDWNGWNDVVLVNATLFHNSNSFSGDVDSGNSHYTNSSCDITQINATWAASSCTFDLIHYADSGSWTCNVTAEDNFNFTSWLTNTTTVNDLFALNVTDLIDYGDMPVDDFSLDELATVTNFGNVDINVSVLGYGDVEGDGLSMVCDQGNITVENQRFSLGPATDWLSKTPLSSVYQDVGITLSQPTDITHPVTSILYWRLYVPPNPFGACTGTLRFTATAT